MPHSSISLAVCGQAQAPFLFPVCTINCTHAAHKTSGGASQACPVSGQWQPMPHCSPRPVAALHPALCCLSNNCTTHKPTFPLSPALPLKLKFKFHSSHQAALLLWWQKISPFMPIGPILPNQTDPALHLNLFHVQPPPCALSLLKWAGKWKQYIEKRKVGISGVTVAVCSQVWHLCTDSFRPTCLASGLQELCQWHWHCSCL